MNIYEKLSPSQVFLKDLDHKPTTGFRETLIFVEQLLLTVPLNCVISSLVTPCADLVNLTKKCKSALFFLKKIIVLTNEQ